MNLKSALTNYNYPNNTNTDKSLLCPSLPLSSESSKEKMLQNFIWQPNFLVSGFLCALVTFVALQRFVRPSNRKDRDLNSNSTTEGQFPQVTWYRMPVPLILDGWYTMKRLGDVGMSLFTECSKKYGKTFQLPFGPINVIATTDPAIIQKLLTSNDTRHLNKSGYIYKRLFAEMLHDGLFVAKPEIWLPHRKCLSKGFIYSNLLSHLSIINTHSQQLKDNILDFISENGSLEDGNVFAKYLGLNLLRFTGDLITGPGSYTDDDILQIQESIETHKNCLLYVFRNPHLFLRPFWRIHSKKRVSDCATQSMLDALRRMIKNHKRCYMPINKDECENPGTFRPLLDLMLDSNWNEKEILDNFATLTFAEHEATFAGIQFTLLHLALNADHQSRCHTEVDAVFKSKVSQDGHLGITDLSQLKYLEHFILESLRLIPPVPVFARRLQAPLKINENLEIGAGRTVIVMPWVLHMDPAYYGSNPKKFDPDRFLPENVRMRDTYTYIPFSAGRRNCLGWKLSLIQLKVTLAWLLRYFHISSVDKLEDVRLFYAVRVVPERNFNLIFKKRAF